MRSGPAVLRDPRKVAVLPTERVLWAVKEFILDAEFV